MLDEAFYDVVLAEVRTYVLALLSDARHSMHKLPATSRGANPWLRKHAGCKWDGCSKCRFVHSTIEVPYDIVHRWYDEILS
jgi:hypothetical protein